MSFTKPFYRYSSRNIAGQEKHPSVIAKRENVLNLWVAGQKTLEIAEALSISENTVKHYLRLARIKGDVRAKKRTQTHYKHRQLRRQERDEQITTLKEHGFSIQQIAKMCNCTERLVYLRLSETRDDD